MGLAELFLGKENPFAQYVADNKQAVHGAFAGLGQGTNFGAGLSNAALGAQRGSLVDDVTRSDTEAEKQRVAQINQTATFLRSKGAEDLAAAVEGGMTTGADAFNSWYQQANAPAETIKPIEVNDQLVNPMTGEVIGDYRDPQAGFGNAPAGYQWNQDGTQTYIPGGPADPALAAANKPLTDAERRGLALSSVVDTDAALLLGDGTKPGVFERLADSGDQFWNIGAFGVNPLKGQASAGYQQATNAVENIAQSYLYAISGQAAPAAEVEKIVNSITPRPFENPAVLAEKKRRLAEYVEAIRMSAGNGNNRTPPGASGDGWEVIGVQ